MTQVTPINGIGRREDAKPGTDAFRDSLIIEETGNLRVKGSLRIWRFQIPFDLSFAIRERVPTHEERSRLYRRHWHRDRMES